MCELTPVGSAPARDDRPGTKQALPLLLCSLRRRPALVAGWMIALTLSCATMLALVEIAGRASHSQAAGLPTWLVVVGGLSAISVALRFYFVTLLSESAAFELKEATYAHLLALDTQFHDRYASGDLLSRLSADLGLVRDAGSAVSVACRSALVMAFCLVSMARASAPLTLAVAMALPVVAFTTMFALRWVRAASINYSAALAQTSALAEERLALQRMVHAFARHADEVHRFRASLARLSSCGDSMAIAGAGLQGATILLSVGGAAALMYYAATLHLNGRVDTQSLVEFLAAGALSLLASIEISHVLPVLARARGALDRIDAVLVEKPMVTSGNVEWDLPRAACIEFRAVTFRYPCDAGRTALHELDLSMPAGRVTALVGASGSGKTTVLRLLLRAYDPATGVVSIDGHDVRSLCVTDLRRALGYVPQVPQIFNGTIRENIAYGAPEASLEQIMWSARLANIDEYIMSLPDGYQTKIGGGNMPISVGQAQRIAIARALVGRPAVLLMDEATSALDADNEKSILAGVLAHVRARGTTVVVATHRLATMMAADSVVLLDRGSAIACGHHHALLATSIPYQQLARASSSAGNAMT